MSGMRAQASSLPYELVVLDSQNDPSKELANVEDLITQGVSAILINPTDSDAVVRAVMLAQDASIPVISLDRSVNGVSVTAHIASDNISGGRMAGEFCFKNWVRGLL